MNFFKFLLLTLTFIASTTSVSLDAQKGKDRPEEQDSDKAGKRAKIDSLSAVTIDNKSLGDLVKAARERRKRLKAPAAPAPQSPALSSSSSARREEKMNIDEKQEVKDERVDADSKIPAPLPQGAPEALLTPEEYLMQVGPDFMQVDQGDPDLQQALERSLLNQEDSEKDDKKEVKESKEEKVNIDTQDYKQIIPNDLLISILPYTLGRSKEECVKQLARLMSVSKQFNRCVHEVLKYFFYIQQPAGFPLREISLIGVRMIGEMRNGPESQVLHLLPPQADSYDECSKAYNYAVATRQDEKITASLREKLGARYASLISPNYDKLTRILRYIAEHGDQTFIGILLTHPRSKQLIIDNPGCINHMLQGAADRGHQAFVELLLTHPTSRQIIIADPECISDALFGAASRSRQAIVERLLTHEVSRQIIIDNPDHIGRALYAATVHGQQALVELLLTHEVSRPIIAAHPEYISNLLTDLQSSNLEQFPHVLAIANLLQTHLTQIQQQASSSSNS